MMRKKVREKREWGSKRGGRKEWTYMRRRGLHKVTHCSVTENPKSRLGKTRVGDSMNTTQNDHVTTGSV